MGCITPSTTLRAPTPSELKFHQQLKEARARIDARAFKPEPPVVETSPAPEPEKLPPGLTRAEIKNFRQAALHAAAAQQLRELHNKMETTFGDVRRLQMIVADHFGCTERDILSNRREQRLVYPRQMAMFLCRDFTTLSYPCIGRRFGGRDHTTVMHAFRKFDAILALPDGIAYGILDARKCLKLRADVAILRRKIPEIITDLKQTADFRLSCLSG